MVGTITKVTPFIYENEMLAQFEDLIDEAVISVQDTILNVIQQNDVSKFQELVDNLNEEQRRILLQEPLKFKFHDSEEKEDPKVENCYKKLEYRELLMIAAVAGAHDVIDVMMSSYGVDVTLESTVGGNVLHALCWGSFFDRAREPTCFKVLETILNRTSMKEKEILLKCEDQDLFRPMELAAKLGNFHLFERILNVDGVYRHHLYRNGLWDTTEYDLSEYNDPADKTRFFRSPVRLLNNLHNEDLKHKGLKRLLGSKVMKKYLNAHLRLTCPILYFWFLYRVVCASTVLYLLGKFNENASLTSPQTCIQYLFEFPDTKTFYCFIGIMCTLGINQTSDWWECARNIYICVKTPKIMSLLGRPGKQCDKIVSHGSFHKSIQGVYLAIIQAIITVKIVITFSGSDGPKMLSSLYQVAAVAVAWTFLLPLQNSCMFGHLIIGFERALHKFFAFSLIFFLVFLSFSYASYILSKVSCFEHSFVDSVYFTFQIFLNQVDLDTKSAQTEHQSEWRAFHMIFAIIMIILLLNYFIAILSESAMEVAVHKETITLLSWIDTAITLYDRLGWFVRKPLIKITRVELGRIRVRETIETLEVRQQKLTG